MSLSSWTLVLCVHNFHLEIPHYSYIFDYLCMNEFPADFLGAGSQHHCGKKFHTSPAKDSQHQECLNIQLSPGTKLYAFKIPGSLSYQYYCGYFISSCLQCMYKTAFLGSSCIRTRSKCVPFHLTILPIWFCAGICSDGIGIGCININIYCSTRYL